MSESPTAISEKSSTSAAARVGWTVLILATLYVCYFSHLGAIGFVGPDEPRYAWIARAMTETGDWVTPRLYGQPWFEKPPLYYWGAALSFTIFGVSEATARLPSAISALFATLALAWLALRMYGAETARWLLLLLPTTVGMIGFSHAAATDMPFSGMLTIAIVCAAVALRLVPATESRPSPTPTTSPTPWAALVLFGFFLGLAVLAKGPAGIILCGGAVFFWAIFTKRWRDVFRLLHPAAIAAFCITALPWYVLCARRNPEFFRVFIIEHNFKRYLTPEFQHIQPFWYYGPILLLALLPWTVIPVWAAISKANEYFHTRKNDPATLLFWMLGAFCLLFFSISQSKLPGYVLPAIPAAGFILSRSVACATVHRLRWLFVSLYVGALLLFNLGILLDTDLLHLGHSGPLDKSGIAALMFFLAVPPFFLASRLAVRSGPWAGRILSALPALWIIVPLFAVPGRYFAAVDRDHSSRFLSERIIARELGPQVRTYRINRSWVYGLDFYLEREVPEWQESPPNDSYVVTSIDQVTALRNSGFSARLIEFGRSGEGSNNVSLYRVTVPEAQ